MSVVKCRNKLSSEVNLCGVFFKVTDMGNSMFEQKSGLPRMPIASCLACSFDAKIIC